MMHRLPFPFFRAASCAALLASIAACDDAGSNHSARAARPDEVPAQASIEHGTTTYGFFTSRDRRPVDVPAFRVTKSPVTVAQFRACVQAGACAAPTKDACGDGASGPLNGRTYAADPSDAVDALPMTCAGATQAQAYCHWVGGALPTIAQWMTAARGRDVARYAWGSTQPRCEQRPDVASEALAGAACGDAQDKSFLVGHHAAGASPYGVEDVLLAPGELIAASTDAPTAACAPPFAACVAYGVRPGAIDSVEAVEPATKDHGDLSRHAYAFRCAFTGDSK